MKICRTAIALAAAALWAGAARAADTTETYGVGASDFELYVGYDGAGLERYEGTISAEALVGFGFTERFSGYVSAFAEGNERFAAGEGGAGFGIFGTPIDSDHFDLDLLLGAGFGDGSMFAAPALELNLDARPDLALCGLYVRAEEDLEGRDDSVADDPATPDVDEAKERYAFAPTTALAFGGYLTLGERHQLLLEYDMALHHGNADAPEGGSELLERGGVALGYNARLTDAIELISQISVDVPNGGERISAGFSLGLIATMPSPGDSAGE
jgi:hypothetical protein